MEIFTERLKLKDILPDRAKDIAKKYKLKEEDIEFIRKKNPLNAEDLQIEDGERAAIRYINTADVDRDNEIVLPSGGQVNDFKKSPTVLYAHNYQGLPIGKDIWLKLVQGKGWLAKTVYAKHQLADDVYNLVKEKFLNTSSIGFIPLESVKPGDKDWDKTSEIVKTEYTINEKLVDKAKRIYTKWLLLEHSDVPVASNISALNIAVGKGLVIKSQELIDDLEIEIIDDEKEEDKIVDEFIEEVNKDDVKKVDIYLDENGKVENTIITREEKNTVTKPEETPDYIRLPAKGEEGKHDGHKIRTIDIDTKQGIKALYCVDDKKTITFLFDKAKGWDIAKAKKWMADHDKDLKIDYVEKEDSEAHQTDVPQAKEEPSRGFSLDEVYEIVKENKELIATLEELTAELKAGAVLNRTNKQDLKDAQAKIQKVLDSAEPAEGNGEEAKDEGIEIEDDGLEIEEKEAKEENDIGINEIKDIVKDYLKKQKEENDKYKKEQYEYISEKMPIVLNKIIRGKVL